MGPVQLHTRLHYTVTCIGTASAARGTWTASEVTFTLPLCSTQTGALLPLESPSSPAPPPAMRVSSVVAAPFPPRLGRFGFMAMNKLVRRGGGRACSGPCSDVSCCVCISLSALLIREHLLFAQRMSRCFALLPRSFFFFSLPPPPHIFSSRNLATFSMYSLKSGYCPCSSSAIAKRPEDRAVIQEARGEGQGARGEG